MQIALTQQELEDTRLKIYQGWSVQSYLRLLRGRASTQEKAHALDEQIKSAQEELHEFYAKEEVLVERQLSALRIDKDHSEDDEWLSGALKPIVALGAWVWKAISFKARGSAGGMNEQSEAVTQIGGKPDASKASNSLS